MTIFGHEQMAAVIGSTVPVVFGATHIGLPVF
jgi:hypothetical protein